MTHDRGPNSLADVMRIYEAVRASLPHHAYPACQDLVFRVVSARLLYPDVDDI